MFSILCFFSPLVEIIDTLLPKLGRRRISIFRVDIKNYAFLDRF